MEDVAADLEELLAIVRMADAVSARVPPSIQYEIDKASGPIDLWRLGICLAALSADTRGQLRATLHRALTAVRLSTGPIEERVLRAVSPAD